MADFGRTLTLLSLFDFVWKVVGAWVECGDGKTLPRSLEWNINSDTSARVETLYQGSISEFNRVLLK